MGRAHDIELEAIREAVKRLGSQSELARRSGVRQGYIARYLNGSVKHIRDDVWDKLYPHVGKYLPGAGSAPAAKAASAASSAGSAPAAKAAPAPAPAPALSAEEQVLVNAFRELERQEQKSVLSCLLSGKPACAHIQPSPCPRPCDSSAGPADAGSSGGTSAA